jgi:sugar phosphate isomerase/epimerase
MQRTHNNGLSRRRFLGAAAGAAAVTAGLPLGSAAAADPAHANGVLIPPRNRGIILYTVRDRISAAPDASGVPYGFAQVFERLSQIGYREVEFAGYTQSSQILGRQITHPEIHQLLDDNGLIANGAHVSIPSSITPATVAAFEQQLDIAETLGMKRVGTGADPTGSSYKADWDTAAERWNTFGQMAAARGIMLYTHNHDAAYNFLLDSGPLDGLGRPTRSSGIRKLEYFFGISDPTYVFFEMDIYWAHVAQHRYRTYTDPHGVVETNVFDPIETVAERKKRFPLFHAKDGLRTGEAPGTGSGYTMVPFGTGDIDFATFFREIGAKGWHLPNYEQDNAPGGSADPGRSLRYAQLSYKNMAALRG